MNYPKQSVHLAVSGGAYLTIEGGRITFGCPGKITVHAAQHRLEGATSLSIAANQWPTTQFDQRVKVVGPDEEPLPNYRYEIHREDGAIIRGVSDGEGWTTLQNLLGLEHYTVRLIGPA